MTYICCDCTNGCNKCGASIQSPVYDFISMANEIQELQNANARLKAAAKDFISDVVSYGESFCTDVGHDPENCTECKLKKLIEE